MSEVAPLMKFTPSAADPEVLEAITVQRGQLVAKLVEDALDIEGGARHRLLIGPRGMGKTHILSLVANRLEAAAEDKPVALAWLDEDPWAIGTYGKFLAAILACLAEARSDPDLERQARELRASGDSEGLAGEQALRDAVGGTRLVLLAENLDEIFRRIGLEGQERLRAFAEDWQQLLILASAPQLFEGIQRHESPFYGFFAVTHLDELSLQSAVELMRRVAELREDDELTKFLATEVGVRRLAAVEALAGGHPRIWLLLSGCVSIQAIDELVPLFLEALDELTPYYQDRLRELGDQQQELVVTMSEAGGALSNRDLAERTGIAQNQIASMLRHLTERGYVRRAEVPDDLATGDARLSYWELREPLMRLCLDVKQARGEPLRMVVAFLRAWYGPRLLDELVTLSPSAKLATTYATEAFRTLEGPLPNEALFRGSGHEIVARAEAGLSLIPDRPDLRVARATGLLIENRYEEARDALEELIALDDWSEIARIVLGVQLAKAKKGLGEAVDFDSLAASYLSLAEGAPDDGEAQSVAAAGLVELRRFADALEVFPRALELRPRDADLMGLYGDALGELGRHEEALTAFEKAAALDPESVVAHAHRGVALWRLDRPEEALEAFNAALALEPDEPVLLRRLGDALERLQRFEEAIPVRSRVIELEPKSAVAHHRLATSLGHLGRERDALTALERAITLEPGNPDLHGTMAVFLDRLDRHEEALEALARGMELDPTSGKFYELKGTTLANMGRPEEALAAFEQAIEFEPSNLESLNHRANVLRRLGRLDEAAAAAERAIEADGGDPGFRMTLAATSLARRELDAGLGQLREALAIYGGQSWEPSQTQVLFEVLWNDLEPGEQRRAAIDGIVEAYAAAEAMPALARYLAGSVRLVAAERVEAGVAIAWADDWLATPEVEDLEIPLRLMRAARGWKEDRDRSHLLELPPELRKVMLDLLPDDERPTVADQEPRVVE